MKNKLLKLANFLHSKGYSKESNQILNLLAQASYQIPGGDLELLPELRGDKYVISPPIQSGKRTTYEYSHKIGPDWREDLEVIKDPDSDWRKEKPFHYNPAIVEGLDVEEDKFGIKKTPKLKEGWSFQIPQNDSYMYRGMSWEEYQSILSSGRIKSEGGYNLGDRQVGLTYFSSEADQARYYADSFAPQEFATTIGRPAIVIALPKMEGVRVPGTGESEIGIPEELSADLIQEVWAGEIFLTSGKGSIDIVDSYGGRERGSRVPPSKWVAWHKIK